MGKYPSYDYPCVTDPRDFSPDHECSSPEEIERHRLACANYGKPSYEPNKGCFSEHSDDGQLVMHVARTSWGIGVSLLDSCDECRELTSGEPLMTCHECGWPEFCAVCWLEHEKRHEGGTL